MTIRLTDGREARLAGVIAATDLDQDPEAVRQAAAALGALVAGRRVKLYGRSEGADRYGRLVAQVVVEGEAVRWVQGELVSAGMLRVAPVAGESACAEILLARERKARAARTGIWAEPRFAVQEADSIHTLTAAGGRYGVVEGTVRHIGEAGGMLYLDFGRRYTEDFSVVIPRNAQAAFTAAGVDLKGLRGKRVRARGILIFRGGPAIELKVPPALEIVGVDGT